MDIWETRLSECKISNSTLRWQVNGLWRRFGLLEMMDRIGQFGIFTDDQWPFLIWLLHAIFDLHIVWQSLDNKNSITCHYKVLCLFLIHPTLPADDTFWEAVLASDYNKSKTTGVTIGAGTAYPFVHDTKGAMGSRKSKNRQCKDQKTKRQQKTMIYKTIHTYRSLKIEQHELH